MFLDTFAIIFMTQLLEQNISTFCLASFLAENAEWRARKGNLCTQHTGFPASVIVKTRVSADVTYITVKLKKKIPVKKLESLLQKSRENLPRKNPI